MKIRLLVLLCSCFVVSVFGQKSETREVGSFQGVRSSEAIDVYLKKGDKESVRVEVSGTELSNVITEISGGNLKIHLRENRNGRKFVKVYVTYTRLDKISASSASNVFSEGVINTSSMEISVSSAASVEVKIESEVTNVDVSSAGRVVLEGKSKSIDVEASSAGVVDAYNLESEKGSARVSSGGEARINVSKELDAHASSGASVRYRGNPLKTNTQSSSGGSVKKTN